MIVFDPLPGALVTCCAKWNVSFHLYDNPDGPGSDHVVGQLLSCTLACVVAVKPGYSCIVHAGGLGWIWNGNLDVVFQP